MTNQALRSTESAPSPSIPLALAEAGRSELKRADRSATTLITVLTSTAAMVGGAESPAPTLWSAGLWGALTVVALTVAFAMGTTMAGWHFVSAVSAGLDRGSVNVQQVWAVRHSATSFEDEMRRLAVVTAGIASLKNRRLRSGVPWLAVTSAAAFIWCLLGTLTN